MSEFSARPFVLAETNWKTVAATDYDVAILPWGATEAHNYHLPYATDNFQADYIAIESAKVAWERGAKIIVMPCVPFGVNTGQMDIKLCVNMNPSTQLAVLRDICEVLNRAGIRKLVIFNGHGGNDFKPAIRELSMVHPELFVCSCNWYEAVDAQAYFAEPGNHAGELETSCMLSIAPHLVRPLNEAGDGSERKFNIQALREGWVTTQRPWTKISKDTGVGNPVQSTAASGEKYLQTVCGKVSDFLVELAAADTGDMFGNPEQD